MDSYQDRKTGKDDVDVEMAREMTEFELKLLETNELIQTRGKVIIWNITGLLAFFCQIIMLWIQD